MGALCLELEKEGKRLWYLKKLGQTSEAWTKNPLEGTVRLLLPVCIPHLHTHNGSSLWLESFSHCQKAHHASYTKNLTESQ